MKRRLPIQKMLLDVPIQVIPLDEFYDASSETPHRHSFFMLLWVTTGSGQHMINFETYQLMPGRVFFIQEGQVHRVISQPKSGWMILFQAHIFRVFQAHYPAHEHHGLFDYLNRMPYVDLDHETSLAFKQLLPLLVQISINNPLDFVLSDYLAILLYHANQLFKPLHPFLVHPVQAGQIRKLKKLIGEFYKQERLAPFYSERLGIVTRKLNELTMRVTGKLVFEIVNDRLLSEAEALLGTTNLQVQEIAAQLNFLGSSHFALFFRKQKGMNPLEFRKKVREFYK